MERERGKDGERERREEVSEKEETWKEWRKKEGIRKGGKTGRVIKRKHYEREREKKEGIKKKQ